MRTEKEAVGAAVAMKSRKLLAAMAVLAVAFVVLAAISAAVTSDATTTPAYETKYFADDNSDATLTSVTKGDGLYTVTSGGTIELKKDVTISQIYFEDSYSDGLTIKSAEGGHYTLTVQYDTVDSDDKVIFGMAVTVENADLVVEQKTTGASVAVTGAIMTAAGASLTVGSDSDADKYANVTFKGTQYSPALTFTALTIGQSSSFDAQIAAGITVPSATALVAAGTGYDASVLKATKLTTGSGETITNGILQIGEIAGSNALTVKDVTFKGETLVSGKLTVNSDSSIGLTLAEDAKLTVMTASNLTLTKKIDMLNGSTLSGVTATQMANVVASEAVPSSTTLVDYPVVVIDGVSYSVVKAYFNDSTTAGTIYFGVNISDIVYTGETVTINDVYPMSLGFGDATAVLYNDGCTIVSEETPVDVGTYEAKLTVNVTNGNAAQGGNKNFTVVVPFEITGAVSTATAQASGWSTLDFDKTFTAPTWTYTAGTTKYTQDDAPADFLAGVKYKIQVSVTTYAASYDDFSAWKAITVSGSASGTVTIEFPAYGNYAECTATVTPDVSITSTATASTLVIKAPTVDTVLGKTVAQIQSITVSGSYTVAGQISKISTWPAFWTAAEGTDAAGYYLAFSVQDAKNTDWSKSTLSITYTSGTTNDVTVVSLGDGNFVAYLGNTAPGAFTTLTVKYDTDGEGTLFSQSTATVTISGLTVRTWTLKLVDEYNDTYVDDEVDDGEYFQLPNGNGSADNVWTLADGTEFQPLAYILACSDYADAKGVITLTAKYDSDPTPTPEPEDAATEVIVALSTTEDGNVYVTLIGVDGYVPTGKITVKVNYAYLDDEGYAVVGADEVELDVTADGNAYQFPLVTITGAEHYQYANTITAEFAFGETTESSNAIVFTPVTATA